MLRGFPVCTSVFRRSCPRLASNRIISINSKFNYSSSSKPTKEAPVKLRYFVLVIALSFGLLSVTTRNMDKKVPVKTSFSEEEYEQLEGLKRKTKLFQDDEVDVFFSPIATDHEKIQVLADRIGAVIIDPESLIQYQLDNDDAYYNALLNRLKDQKKPFPKGMITALIKMELKKLNGTKGSKTFIIENFPQTIDEAIKFEDDVASSKKVITFTSDTNESQSRETEDILKYFDTVDKVVKIEGHDKMDRKLLEIVLKDY